MRGPMSIVLGRYRGMPRSEIARRTVPCYKYVQEPDGERLALCVLVDAGWLYRWPYETASINSDLALKANLLHGQMEHLRLREFQPRRCRYVHVRQGAGVA